MNFDKAHYAQAAIGRAAARAGARLTVRRAVLQRVRRRRPRRRGGRAEAAARPGAHRRSAARAVLPRTERFAPRVRDRAQPRRGHRPPGGRAGRVAAGDPRHDNIRSSRPADLRVERARAEGLLAARARRAAGSARGGRARTACCAKGIDGFPEMSEVGLVRHFTRLSTWNYGVDTGMYPLGSCTMKYNPKVNEAAARIGGFAELHPLAPDEVVAGRARPHARPRRHARRDHRPAGRHAAAGRGRARRADRDDADPQAPRHAGRQPAQDGAHPGFGARHQPGERALLRLRRARDQVVRARQLLSISASWPRP